MMLFSKEDHIVFTNIDQEQGSGKPGEYVVLL